jgi:hypothetical protein
MCSTFGCGPAGAAAAPEAESSGSTHEGSVTTGIGDQSSEGSTAVPTTETGSPAETGAGSSSTDTGAGLGPCLASVWATPETLAPRDYLGALRVDAPAVARLVFGGEVDGVPYTTIVAADVVDGPWLLAQQLDGVAPHDIGDIDGDGRDDLVVVDGTGIGGWWRALPDGSLQPSAEFAVADDDADALVRFPGDPVAGLAHVDAELSIAHGNGDGTLAAPATIDPLAPDTMWSAPVIAWDEGIVSVGAHAIDCERACPIDTIVLRIDDAGTITELGHVDAGGELLDIGDIDGDEQLDLVLRETADGVLRIHRGGQETFDPPLADPQTRDATASDVDSDGDLDLFTATQGAAFMVRFNHDFDLSSSNTIEVTLESPLRLGRAVDLDGNGITEVMLSGNDSRHELQYTKFCD